MEFWNTIITTAMIGTDKKNIGSDDLPNDLTDIATLINANETIDKEEKFLQLAAVALNYRQAGVLPAHNTTAGLSMSAAEYKPYCNPLAMQALKDIQSEESIPLLKMWLQSCNAKNQIVQPEMVPALLATGVQHKSLQTVVASCCGQRGQWLSKFNDAWNFSQNETAEQLWQTGTNEQRKSILKETRTVDPSLARDWLLQSWSQEDAATKSVFLDIFSNNISVDDIVFLESLSTEKSKKVKEQALLLLKKIPSSTVVQSYQKLLQQSVELRKEKGLFGLTSKKALHWHLPGTIDDSIFKSGIDKLSNNKNFTDDEFIINQLIQSVPMNFWEMHFEESTENIIEHFQKDTIGKKMVPAFVIAVTNFRDEQWAFKLMQHTDVFYLDLLPLLPTQQQDFYSTKFFDQFAVEVISYATQRDMQWSHTLAEKICRYIALHPYQYNRSFFNNHIHLIPASIVPELAKFSPTDEYQKSAWNNTIAYITKLITLKTQTLKAFSA